MGIKSFRKMWVKKQRKLEKMCGMNSNDPQFGLQKQNCPGNADFLN